jgi:hypothetical protein
MAPSFLPASAAAVRVTSNLIIRSGTSGNGTEQKATAARGGPEATKIRRVQVAQWQAGGTEAYVGIRLASTVSPRSSSSKQQAELVGSTSCRVKNGVVTVRERWAAGLVSGMSADWW